jgi:uncharacterized protein (DUF2249 family)
MYYKKETHVPLPVRNQHQSEHSVLYNLSIGESVLVPGENAPRTRSALAHHARTHGKRFLTRTVKEGLRVWRVF